MNKWKEVTVPPQGSIVVEELQARLSSCITWNREAGKKSLRGCVFVQILLNNLSVQLMVEKPSRLRATIAHNYFLTQLPIFKYLLHAQIHSWNMEYNPETLLWTNMVKTHWFSFFVFLGFFFKLLHCGPCMFLTPCIICVQFGAEITELMINS